MTGSSLAETHNHLAVLLDGRFQFGHYLYVIDEEGNLVEDALPDDFGNQVWDHPYIRKEGLQYKIETAEHSSLFQAYRRFVAIYDVFSRSLDQGQTPKLLGDQDSLKLSQLFGFSFSNEALRTIEEELDMDKNQVYAFITEQLPNYKSFLNKIYAPDREGDLLINQDVFTFGFGQPDLVLTLQVNPFEVEGLSVKQARMIQLLIIKILLDQENFSNQPLDDQASLDLLKNLKDLAESLSCSPYYFEALDEARSKIQEGTCPSQLLSQVEDLTSWAQSQARDYQEEKLERPWILKGFEEMENSTQNYFYDAIYKGVRIEILDEADHFLRLSVADHVEYVQQANRSNRVSYIHSIIMENKHVTKFLLDEAGFQVPQGEMYTSRERAKNEFWRFEDMAFVVKPKSTNAGVGITVFKEKTSRESYEEAIDIAFEEDNAILVEEFVHGIEYRFHILGGKCKDVLLRMPAHVKGDGIHNVEELVVKKNEHPYRGEAGRSPLVNIKFGQIETLMLKEQGLDLASIPEKGRIVYLRENSNISTGGDSEIVGDICHPSYINIAEEIAKALDTPICGVDMIIEDLTQPISKNHPGYYVIETNANPGMYGHLFVSRGEGSRLTMALLDELFPELEINFQPRLSSRS